MEVSEATARLPSVNMRQRHETTLLEHLLQEVVGCVYECKESLDALQRAAGGRRGSFYRRREDEAEEGRIFEEDEEEARRETRAAGYSRLAAGSHTPAQDREAALAAAADALEKSQRGRGKYSKAEHRYSSSVDLQYSDTYESPSSSPRRRGVHEERHLIKGDDLGKVEMLARQLLAYVTGYLLSSVERTKNTTTALRASHAHVSEKLQRFEGIVERQTEQLEELQQDLHMKKESESLRQKNLTGALEHLREENEELRSQVATAERALEQQRQEKAVLEQRLQQILQQQEQQRQKSDSTSSDTTVSDMSGALESARRELRRLATAAVQKDSLIEDLKTALRARQEEASLLRFAESFTPSINDQQQQGSQGMLPAHRSSSLESAEHRNVMPQRTPSSSGIQRKRKVKQRAAVAAASSVSRVENTKVSAVSGNNSSVTTADGLQPLHLAAAADSSTTPAAGGATAPGTDTLRWAFMTGRTASPRGAALTFLTGNRATFQRNKHVSEVLHQQQLRHQQLRHQQTSPRVLPQAGPLSSSMTLAGELLGGCAPTALSRRSSLQSSSGREDEAERNAAKQLAVSKAQAAAAAAIQQACGEPHRQVVGDIQLQQQEQQQRHQVQQQREQQLMAAEELRGRLEAAAAHGRMSQQQQHEELAVSKKQLEQQLREAETHYTLLQQQHQREQELWQRQLLQHEEERQIQLLEEKQQQRDEEHQLRQLQRMQELQERLRMQLEDQHMQQEEELRQFKQQITEREKKQEETEELSAQQIAALEKTISGLKKSFAEVGKEKQVQQQLYLEEHAQMQELERTLVSEQQIRKDLNHRIEQQQQQIEKQQLTLEGQAQQIAEQQQRIQHKQRQRDQQQRHVEQLQMRIEELDMLQLLHQKNELHQQTHLQQTQEACESLRMRSEELQQQLEQRQRLLEAQVDLQKQQQEEAERQMQALSQEHQTQQEQRGKLLEEETKKRQQLHQQLEKLQEIRTNLQQQLEQQQQQTEGRRQQYEEVQNQKEQQQRQLEQQRRQLEQQQKELEQQRTKLEQQQKLLLEQKHQLKHQQRHFEEQQQETRKLEKELEEERHKQLQVKVLEQQLAILEHAQREKQSHIAAAEATIVEKGNEIRGLQEEIRHIKQQMGDEAESLRDRLREALAANEKEASTLAALRLTRDTEAAAAAKLSTEAAAALRQLHAKHSSLENAFSASQEEVGSLRRLCDTLKKELVASRMKREKEFESYKQAIKLRNAERKKQVQQMLEVNESLAMRKEEVETRLIKQLQDFQDDIHALIRLHMQNTLLKRSVSQLAGDAVQQPALSSSFANRVWHAYDQKLSESMELTDRSGSIRSTRRSARPVDMYRPVALSIRSLRPHSRREERNESDLDEADSQLSRECSGIDDGKGDNNMAVLDFFPSFMVKLRDKLFTDDSYQLSSSRQRPALQPADSPEDSDAERLTRRWQVRRSLAVNTPIATPMPSARSAGVAGNGGKYRRGGNSGRMQKLTTEKGPEGTEQRDFRADITEERQ